MRPVAVATELLDRRIGVVCGRGRGRAGRVFVAAVWAGGKSSRQSTCLRVGRADCLGADVFSAADVAPGYCHRCETSRMCATHMSAVSGDHEEGGESRLDSTWRVNKWITSECTIIVINAQ